MIVKDTKGMIHYTCDHRGCTKAKRSSTMTREQGIEALTREGWGVSTLLGTTVLLCPDHKKSPDILPA